MDQIGYAKLLQESFNEFKEKWDLGIGNENESPMAHNPNSACENDFQMTEENEDMEIGNENSPARGDVKEMIMNIISNVLGKLNQVNIRINIRI